MSNILSKAYLSLSDVSVLMGFTGKTIYDKNRKTRKFLEALQIRTGIPILIKMGTEKKPSYKIASSTIQNIMNPSGDICLMEELKHLKEQVTDLKERVEFLESREPQEDFNV